MIFASGHNHLTMTEAEALRLIGQLSDAIADRRRHNRHAQSVSFAIREYPPGEPSFVSAFSFFVTDEEQTP
jgi:hypothetical protein